MIGLNHTCHICHLYHSIHPKDYRFRYPMPMPMPQCTSDISCVERFCPSRPLLRRRFETIQDASERLQTIRNGNIALSQRDSSRRWYADPAWRWWATMVSCDASAGPTADRVNIRRQSLRSQLDGQLRTVDIHAIRRRQSGPITIVREWNYCARIDSGQ